MFFFSPPFSCLSYSMHKCRGNNSTVQGCGDSLQWEKTKEAALALVLRHTLLQESRAILLRHSSVVLENGLERQGGMSSILNFQHSRHPRQKDFFGQDESISSDLSLCSQIDVVQSDKLEPSQTCIPIRWEYETDKLHWGTRPELRANRA